MIEKNSLTLLELSQKIDDVINASFKGQYFWIVSEISSHKFYPINNRHYFEFVEKIEGSHSPVAKMKGISWNEGSEKIQQFEKITGQIFTNSIEVLTKVKVEYHKAYGIQLILVDIDHSFTLGNLEKKRRETLELLITNYPNVIKKVGDDYLTLNKVANLNLVIQKIALIGSDNSEGYTDFNHSLTQNQFSYIFHLDIYKASVQGKVAENEIISQLINIYNSKIKYDCVVIIRGGGSQTDFLVFDAFKLAYAVAKFPIPIITGLGHHKDVSIVDLMTHTSTKTPTKAAEFIVSYNRSFEESLFNFQHSLIIRSQQLLKNATHLINESNIIIINKSRTLISDFKEKLNEFNQIIVNRSKSILYNRQTNLVALLNNLLSIPRIITANRKSELQNITNNLKVNTHKLLVNERGYLNHYNSVIKLMSPENILKKGFAIISQNGNILNNAEKINLGNEIKIIMENTIINTKVISKSKNDGTSTNL